MNVKAKALSFLGKREYSYKELFAKLQKYSENLAEITEVLNNLQESGLLSEKRYIQAYLNSKKNKYGINKIKYNLKQKTADTELINSIIQDNAIDEYEIAKNLCEKKFNGIKATDKNQLAKQIRFLSNNGFSFDVINKIIKAQKSE